MINARSETAHVKPSFRNLMKRKRCLIIADSFYEWQHMNEEKIPKRIQLKDRKLFAFAGLWDKWQNNGKTLFTCTILTKDSHGFMQDIHHRMPIILPKNQEETWIKRIFSDAKSAQEFVYNLDMEPLTAYTVSDFVNNA